ncbi:hypothetical protein GO003_024035 [Methylicorpusculum oleiharenae]|uniref:hypothetical protein n=1 Tax=Methylicorpusculum oleiharenae TaxID=1338687 RepID=UPI00135C394D|nr:hypothetical protein [Methylicorpusculum oleiharenae]MCD2453455.1 hypothetical protein [Methylicorpusculum oleiharenae]
MNTAKDLAMEYFKVGNAIVAFYVLQTLLFVNAIYKEHTLLTVLSQSNEFARYVTCVIAVIYILVVLACLIAEIYLRKAATTEPPESQMVLFSTYCAGVGRVLVISVVALGCSWLIENLKEIPANV